MSALESTPDSPSAVFDPPSGTIAGRTTAGTGLHPRPQLTRPDWFDLCGTWAFAYDDDDSGREAGWPERVEVFDRSIEVPFPPESELSGIGDTSFHPVVWYRRTFVVDPTDVRRWLLHFGAVDYRAEVWVNGHLVVRHEGGHVPFSADVTEVLAAGGEQVLVVRAEDQPTDAHQPRGKQDVEPGPHNVWYHRTTGIWQPVWLEPVPSRRIDRVRFVTDVDRGVLGVHVDLVKGRAGDRLVVRVTRRDETLADDSVAVTPTSVVNGVQREIEVLPAGVKLNPRAWLWAPEHPNLMDVTVALVDEEGELVDSVDSYVGFRSVGTSSRRFTLNGHPYYLRLVLEQGYWPRSLLAAPSAEALRREVELVKELGFNGVRVHQKVEDPRYLYWCDRLGVAVWAEVPAAYGWSDTAVTRSATEWLDVLRRDASVPSIVTWVPVNESWGVPNLQTDPAQRAFVQAMYSLARAVDPTRPVVGNDGWEHVATDMLTVHDYAADGQTLRDRYGSRSALEESLTGVQPYYRPLVLPGFVVEQQPVLLSEFGGISYRAGEGAWTGYGSVDDEEEFQRRYADLLGAVLDSPVLAGFCYTQLTDTEQERNGLLTADREPKADIAVLRAATRRVAAAVPGDAIPGDAVPDPASPNAADGAALDATAAARVTAR